MTNSNPSARERRNAPRRRPTDKDTGERNYRDAGLLLFFPLTFIYLELVTHLALFSSLTASFFIYSTLFSAAAGFLCALVCSAFKRKINYFVTLGILGFITVYFGVQLVYSKFFKDFFYWDLLGVGGNFLQFWRQTLVMIFENLWLIILLFVPFILFAVFGRRRLAILPMSWTMRAVAAVLTVIMFISAVAFVNRHDGLMEDKYYYNDGFSAADSAGRFGILTVLRLDTKYTLFGHKDSGELQPSGEATSARSWDDLFGSDTAPSAEESTAPAPETRGTDETTQRGYDPDPITTEPEETTEAPKPVDTSPNVLDIDFSSLIEKAGTTALKNAHTYFSTREATNKNEYTGLFEGKNLIWITVESWAPAAINEKLTPTLWKMKTQGFVFENYFCSNWGGSTATGEYAVMSGNFYNSSNCLTASSKTLERFGMGSMLKAEGYSTYAFHNWTYTYYGRNLSHPNFGYTYFGVDGKDSTGKYYKGLKGWDVQFTKAWPLSDRELAANTLSYITADKPFHLYYMSVSGHAPQTFVGNTWANRHKADALEAGVSYTNTSALAYVCCQYEVELMVSELCKELEAKGILEDTVFVLAPDHYPYSISGNDEDDKKALAELYNLPADGIFTNYNLYRAPLIIWSGSMEEPVQVSKVCSAIDILPTLLNLFGLDYDSRLIMGRDILSTSEGFVILNMSNSGSVNSSYNWITDYGFYSNATKQFTPFSGVTVDSASLKDYITHYTTQVTTMYKYSKYILDNDYYRKVFG